MALKYEGCTQFRQRIVAATLSGRKLRIGATNNTASTSTIDTNVSLSFTTDKIRDQDESPGLQDFEASFLRLVEKITDGASSRISFLASTIKLTLRYNDARLFYRNQRDRNFPPLHPRLNYWYDNIRFLFLFSSQD
jgi:hypothetical protein